MDEARLQVHTLYVVDDQERLLAVNDIGRPPAPWCHLAATATGWHQWYGATAPSEFVAAVQRFCESTPPRPLYDPPHELATTDFFAGPAYVVGDRPEGGGGNPAYRIEVCESADAVRAGLPDWVDELEQRQPAVVAFDGTRAVAICASVRIGTRACEAGVETVPEYRGHGLGAAVTAAWAEAVRDRGLVPLYSTSWHNVASQGVARRLGMRRYAATLVLRPPGWSAGGAGMGWGAR